MEFLLGPYWNNWWLWANCCRYTWLVPCNFNCYPFLFVFDTNGYGLWKSIRFWNADPRAVWCVRIVYRFCFLQNLQGCCGFPKIQATAHGKSIHSILPWVDFGVPPQLKTATFFHPSPPSVFQNTWNSHQSPPKKQPLKPTVQTSPKKFPCWVSFPKPKRRLRRLRLRRSWWCPCCIAP